jgi:putative polyhydroxyalkanoate system protein
MANIRVQQPHQLSQAKAKEAVGQFEEMLGKYRAKLEWNGFSAKIKGIGVGGDVMVSDREVTVNVELGMMARAAGIDAEKLKGSIARRLQEALV